MFPIFKLARPVRQRPQYTNILEKEGKFEWKDNFVTHAVRMVSSAVVLFAGTKRAEAELIVVKFLFAVRLQLDLSGRILAVYWFC